MIALLSLLVASTTAFLHGSKPSQSSPSSLQPLYAQKPRRLPENIEGVVYVNDKCINCAACSGFAPQTFSRNGMYHIVHEQPKTKQEIQKARQALLACPVAAIRVETQREHEKRQGDMPWSEQDQHLVQEMTGKTPTSVDKEELFPRPLLDSVPNVYWVGHHNSASFGAIPYLVQVNSPAHDGRENSDRQWIMVDTPKFSPSAIRAVTSLTGPQGPSYLFLSHVDDTADHGKWAEHFPRLKRIFHRGDLGRHNWLNDRTLEDVEILLDSHSLPPDGTLVAYSIDGEVLPPRNLSTLLSTSKQPVILHTPGHSPGSISLWVDGVLFTGDTYSYTTRTNSMTGFPRYGNDRRQQADVLERLLKGVDYQVIAPGHGHARDYRTSDAATKSKEMEVAIEELQRW